MRYFQVFSFVLFTLVFSCCANGCKKPGTLDGLAPCEGIVQQAGKPVPGATLTLLPEGGGASQRPAGAVTDENGRFNIATLNPGDGAFPGDYRVSVTKIEPTGRFETINSPDDPGGKTKIEITENKLPKKYENADQSGLKITVPASGVKDIVLELQ